jgi:hypothetical protein
VRVGSWISFVFCYCKGVTKTKYSPVLEFSNSMQFCLLVSTPRMGPFGLRKTKRNVVFVCFRVCSPVFVDVCSLCFQACLIYVLHSISQGEVGFPQTIHNNRYNTQHSTQHATHKTYHTTHNTTTHLYFTRMPIQPINQSTHTLNP